MATTATVTSGEHGHDPHLAHHFDSHEQQFDAGKLGIWLFLAQEILFFSGLFCAYAVYRANHPEVFAYAHHFLDVKWGFINTLVLLTSSLTAAWSVRAIQLGNRQQLLTMVGATILFAFVFLGIKFVEYSHKWEAGFLNIGKGVERGQYFDPEVGEPLAIQAGHEAAVPHGIDPAKLERPKNTKIFFGIYFALTGLHGLHVIAGIIVYLWIMIRALKGHFSPTYYGPVDFAALYWHLVDLVWIYLFPLLYLIH